MKVKSFCKARNVDIPKINTHYVAGQGRGQHQEDNFTIEHHRVNIFYVAIDCELQELSSPFNKHAMELLIISSTLEPRECRKSFRIGDTCQLVDRFYPIDFIDVGKMKLKIQIKHYEYSV